MKKSKFITIIFVATILVQLFAFTSLLSVKADTIPAPTLDPNSKSHSYASYDDGTKGTVTISTTNSADVTYAVLYTDNTGLTVNKPSSVHLSQSAWTLRASISYGDNDGEMNCWYAVANSALSNEVITFSTTKNWDEANIMVFSVSGTNTASPFDLGLPTTLTSGKGAATGCSQSSSVTISTKTANDLLIGLVGVSESCNSITFNSLSLINGVNECGVCSADGYKTLSSTGSQTVKSNFCWSPWVTITDAFVPAYGSATHFSISTPTQATAGTSFSITVTALDASGNKAAGYSGTIHFTSSDGQAILPVDSTLSGGVGTFTVTLETSGTQTITATDKTNSGITGSATLPVVANSNSPGEIIISPSSASIAAGGSQSFTATLYDIYGNSLGDVTNSVSWSINSGAGTYQWSQNTVSVYKAGDWTVTASFNVPDAAAQLTVTNHLLTPTSITVSPKTSTIDAGNSETFTATASDGFNTWDVTGQVVWSIDSGAGGSWNQATATYTSANAGTWTVTATLGSLSDTASLTVNPNTNLLDHIVISPNISTITAGQSQTYSATAYDSFGNSWTVVASYSCPGASVDGNSISATTAGTYTVTGTYGGQSDTSTLTVNPDANSVTSLAISPQSQTIVAGSSQTYQAIATDSYGNIWDVSVDPGTVWSINSGSGTWTGSSVDVTAAGDWTVTATYQGQSSTASLTVTLNTNSVESLAVSPKTQTIVAGTTITYTAIATDSFGNTFDVSTDSGTIWAIDTSAGGSWSQATYTAAIAGTWTVTATYSGLSDTASLTVTHATDPAYLNHIAIAPKTAAVNAGSSQAYTATAYDTFGNSWIVTANYSCPSSNVIISGNSAYSNTDSTYTITGTFNGKSDTATLTVTGHLSTIATIAVSPKTASVVAGSPQSFTATASDGFNTWDVTGQVVWSIDSGAGGSWNQATGTYTSATAGTWTVKATLATLSDTATLTVNANPSLLDHITISPKSPTVPAGTPQSFTVTAYDKFGNSLGDVTPLSTFNLPGAIVTGNSITVTNGGVYIVTASYQGLTDTASLTVTGTVTGTTSTHYTAYTVTFTESGLPAGTGWNVNFEGKSYSSTTSSMSINGVSTGSYLWTTPQSIGNSLTQYVASETSGTMGVPSQLTENIAYTTQYLITYTTTGNVLPVSDPANQWVNSGGQATGAFPSRVVNSAGNTRCNFVTDNRATITAPTTITATYQTQYAMTFNQTGIGSDAKGTIVTVAGVPETYSQLPSINWVNNGATVTFSFNSTVESATANKSYALTSVNATSPLTITAPIVVQGTYESRYSTPLYTILGTTIVFLVLLLLVFALLATKRRRKKKDLPKTSPEAPLKTIPEGAAEANPKTTAEIAQEASSKTTAEATLEAPLKAIPEADAKPATKTMPENTPETAVKATRKTTTPRKRKKSIPPSS